MWFTFREIITVPFHNTELIWGIVPLYFGWILNELTSARASFRTAIQTGFTFTWAAAQWLFQYAHRRPAHAPVISADALLAINMIVTLAVLAVGLLALWSGLRRRFPRGAKFLGHSRFAAYFTIAMFPMQAHYLPWTADRLLAVLAFAVPVWLVVHLGFIPLRR
jgi:hypothetical protein